MKSYGALTVIALLSTSVAGATTASACAKDPYKALLPLSKYAPATSFCSSKYPLSTVTSTSTVTVTAGSHNKRGSTTTAKALTTTSAKPTTSACTGDCATWSSCTQKAGSFLSTLCSCIETQKTTTITKTSTVTPTTTSSAPAMTCTDGRLTGPDRCNCYYDEFCNSRYLGTANATTTVSSYAACVTFAGNVKTGSYQPANLNYFPASGLCQAFIYPPGTENDNTVIAAAAVYNFENCYLHDIQDLNRNGCGCDYAEDCDNYYEGEVYKGVDVSMAGVADCQQACDFAGSNCIGFTIYGGTQCTLYKTITNKSSTFGTTGYYQVSCPKPCVAS